MGGFAAGIDFAELRLAGLVLAAWQRKRAAIRLASVNAIRLASLNSTCSRPVSYTHLTLPTNREV